MDSDLKENLRLTAYRSSHRIARNWGVARIGQTLAIVYTYDSQVNRRRQKAMMTLKIYHHRNWGGG